VDEVRGLCRLSGCSNSMHLCWTFSSAKSSSWFKSLGFVCWKTERSFKFQNVLQWFQWQRSCCTVSQTYLCGCTCIFCGCVLFKSVSLTLVHVPVWTLIEGAFYHFIRNSLIALLESLFARTGGFDTSLHIWKNTHWRVCTCARVCAVCSLALGNEGRGVQLVYSEHLLMAWDIIIHTRKDKGLSIISLFFWHGWECMWVYVCVYAHTRTHNARGVLGCEPKGPGSGQDTWRAQRFGEESRWTKFRHICIHTCVQSIHMYIYHSIGRRAESLD